jgi:phage tail sheath protein FI
MAIVGVTTAVTAFVGSAQDGPVETAVPVTSFSEFESRFGGLWGESPMTYAVSHFFAAGGRDALIVRVVPSNHLLTDADLSAPELRPEHRGIWALEHGGRFNLLCVPPFGFDSDIGAATRASAAALATACRAFFVVDPLRDWREPADLADPAIGLESTRWGLERSPNAACYFPRVRMPDPLQNGEPAEFMPCGLVAGIYARTDRERGVWKTPAGVDATLPGVVELTATLSAVQHEQLAARGVNGLRRVSGGHVVWGGRTLQGDDRSATDWKYVPVRRLFLFLEQSIEQGLQWSVFEPNGEPLWTRIRGEVEEFMQTLFRQGAFQGRSPQDAWFVKCGPDTTSQAELDAGTVNVVVGFAPLKPAEFVIISIRLMVGGTGKAGGRHRG